MTLFPTRVLLTTLVVTRPASSNRGRVSGAHHLGSALQCTLIWLVFPRRRPP